MEQTLTPPPSFRALRVRTRPRTRTTSDENECGNIATDRITEGGIVSERTLKETSPARGRTRSRITRNGLTLNTGFSHTHFSLGLSACCSPMYTRNELSSSDGDEDLIFQMSPVQGHSSSPFCSEGARQVRADANRVRLSTTQTLSALWEKHKSSLSGTDLQQLQSPRTPNRRSHRGSFTRHQRGLSDTHATDFPRRERRGEHRPRQSAKALFDLTPIPQAPIAMAPPSPPAEEPFMYSFPTFDSSPLMKAREARACRQASRTHAREEYLTDGVESESIGGKLDISLEPQSNVPSSQRYGPIRARNLRIQSGESLPDDVDDTNYISHAFKSTSLDPEKDTDFDGVDEGEAFDNGYYWSQRSSSVSSSSTGDATSLDHSNLFSSSLLASFPVMPSSRSRTHSNSRSHAQSRHVSQSEIDPEATATAMMNRGRTFKRGGNESRQPTGEYTGGDRRGRGRTPPGRRQNTHSTSSGARTRMH
ncbi:hypothetical protein ACEPAF_9726 [Sanghuangporus sanghuang]